MYAYTPPQAPKSVICTDIATALAAVGLAVAASDITWLGIPAVGGPAVGFAASVPALTFPQQQAVDDCLAECGYGTTYPMTTSAPSTAAVGSTVTVTADTGDAGYAGPVEFYIGGTLQTTETAVGGKASCGITSASSGTVTVYAWVPAYGYADAEVTFS